MHPFTLYTSLFIQHTFIHCGYSVQGQYGIQYLAQGHFWKQTGVDRNQTIDLLVSGCPAQSPEPQLDQCTCSSDYWTAAVTDFPLIVSINLHVSRRWYSGPGQQPQPDSQGVGSVHRSLWDSQHDAASDAEALCWAVLWLLRSGVAHTGGEYIHPDMEFILCSLLKLFLCKPQCLMPLCRSWWTRPEHQIPAGGVSSTCSPAAIISFTSTTR